MSNYTLNYTGQQVDNLLAGISDKAPLISPQFQGTPTAPTATNSTNSTQIATTAFVKNVLSNTSTTTIFKQENTATSSFITNANYSANNYNSSVISTYNSSTYGNYRYYPNNYTIEKPTEAVNIKLIDTVTGWKYTEELLGTSINITNLIPDHLYLYEILDSSKNILQNGFISATGNVRMINSLPNGSVSMIDSTYNIRDIGGWQCDGGSLAYGKIFRGSELTGENYSQINDTQKKFFTDFLRIRDEIDLRISSEVDDDNITSSALGDQVDYIRVGLAAYSKGIDPENAEYNVAYRASYATVFKRIASDLEKGRPIYLHCVQGADRTGTICALLEGICGVAQTDIDKEYELTTFASYKPLDDNHTAGTTERKRNNSIYWKPFITSINKFSGDTFRDKILTYLIGIGLTIDEINTIRHGLIDGIPMDLVEPEVSTARLPVAYQEVEWLESTGTQTIQIDFASNLIGAYLETDIMRTSNGTRNLIGSANSGTTQIGAAAGSYFGWDTNNKYEMGGTSTTNIVANNTDFDHIKFEWYATGSGKLYVNGTQATSRAGSGSYSQWNVFGGTNYPVSCKMKEVKIYNVSGGGTLTADLVPCYRKSDSVAGMYDIVGNTFLTNIGTGTFSVGNDVIE